MNKKTLYTFAAIPLVFSAVAVSAQNVNVDANAQVNTTASTDESSGETNSNTSASVDTDNNIGSQINSGIDATVNAASDLGAQAEAEINSFFDSASEVASEIDTDTSATITLSGDNLRANSNTSIESSSDVSTSDDFRVFVQTQARNDMTIESVSADKDSVTVTYNKPVKLFGFINTNMDKTVKVMADASSDMKVKVSNAWWAFMAAGTNTANEATALKSSISGMTISADASLSVRTQAEIVEAIMLSARSDINANTSVSAQ